MKKIIVPIIFLLIMAIGVILSPSVEAASMTLGDYRKELKQFEDDYANNLYQKQLTQAEISATRKQIGEIYNEIDYAKQEIVNLEKEIEELDIEITNKTKEIKEIVNFVQVSSGESAYMEYIFGAKDFTDFIYRTVVSEQLSSYNDKLIKDFTAHIELNNKKTAELAQKQKDLAAKQVTLKNKLTNLNASLAGLSEDGLTIENEIKAMRDTIKTYEDMGCKDTDTFESCAKGKLPPGTKFYRPLVSGSVTFEYGESFEPYYDFHKGIDVSTTDNNTPVYAAAAGVVTTTLHQRCGNNIVLIQHNINGQNYTTAYWHMRSINVSRGDYVTKDTQIGIMGGRSSEDSCSTGAHVHFVVSVGLHNNTVGMHSNLVNPRKVLNVPCIGTRFNDRLTAYSCGGWY